MLANARDSMVALASRILVGDRLMGTEIIQSFANDTRSEGPLESFWSLLTGNKAEIEQVTSADD